MKLTNLFALIQFGLISTDFSNSEAPLIEARLRFIIIG